MKLLTYTAPEERYVPTTLKAAEPHYYELGTDPLWRRFLMDFGASLSNWASDWIVTDSPEIIWVDRLRWKIDGWATSILWLGMEGSIDNDEMMINGEIPWQYVGRDDRLRLFEKYPWCFVPVTPETCTEALIEDEYPWDEEEAA